ncbi:MAG: hypothetical protein L0332_19480 [Chloroflexi bacterium]|nr:hypothetical protein [Chloroflexota bacterium]MCI0574708.1 hypothetical protein [Chloroflexota bacterium]MCI0647399.1 hypothetical protein [Chloroflexota bacterium]MCI0728878.1 hypothetical protein [Chloroflexota bacterium]
MTQTEDSLTTLNQLQTKWEVQERPFVSHAPLVGSLIARLRTAWNNVAARWYVRAILQQQNDFNLLVVRQFYEVQAQHRETLARYDEVVTRFQGFDDRLISQDRDHTSFTQDLAELTTQVIQMNRRLQALDERLARLENSRANLQAE